MKLCGAPTRRGTPCRRAAGSSGRCTAHADTPVSEPVSRRAAGASLYRDVLDQGDQDLWNEVPLGHVDDELRLLRLRLRRLAAERGESAHDAELLRLTGRIADLEGKRAGLAASRKGKGMRRPKGPTREALLTAMDAATAEEPEDGS